MKKILDDWQREALKHKGNLLLCTGRQVGKTYILSRKAAERMVERKTNILVASLTEDQAKLIIVMTLVYLEKYYKRMIAKKKNKPTQNKIILTNGSQILARPVGNTGNALRGFTGDVFIPDEMSRMPPMVWTAGLPTLLTSANPEIWGASTPFGKEGYFWECYQNKNEFWKVIHVSSEDVIYNRKISETWTEKQRNSAINFLNERKKEMGESEYGQEYLGLFLDNLQRFFSDELIDKVCTLKRPEYLGSLQGKNYLGCDIARLGDDEGTYEIINELNDRYAHVENQITKKQLTTQTEKKIIDIAAKWKVRKVGIDAGAGTLGVSVLDHLLTTSIKHKIIPLNNRKISLDDEDKTKQRLLKEDLYQNLKSMLEHGELFLLDDPEVRLSLASIQYEFSKEEDKKTKMRIFGNYAHIVEGLIRAAYLAKKEKSLNLWAY